jgi:hypothetical protein
VRVLQLRLLSVGDTSVAVPALTEYKQWLSCVNGCEAVLCKWLWWALHGGCYSMGVHLAVLLTFKVPCETIIDRMIRHYYGLCMSIC